MFLSMHGSTMKLNNNNNNLKNSFKKLGASLPATHETLQPLLEPDLPQKCLLFSLSPPGLLNPYTPRICNASLWTMSAHLFLGFPWISFTFKFLVEATKFSARRQSKFIKKKVHISSATRVSLSLPLSTRNKPISAKREVKVVFVYVMKVQVEM